MLSWRYHFSSLNTKQIFWLCLHLIQYLIISKIIHPSSVSKLDCFFWSSSPTKLSYYSLIAWRVQNCLRRNMRSNRVKMINNNLHSWISSINRLFYKIFNPSKQQYFSVKILVFLMESSTNVEELQLLLRNHAFLAPLSTRLQKWL